MAISVRTLYEQICDGILEPEALTGDVMTDDDFIALVNQTISDFMGLGLYGRWSIVQTLLGVRKYEDLNPVTIEKEILVDQSSMQMNSGFYWDKSDAQWQNQPPGEPQEWRQDQSDANHFEIRPSPCWTGQDIELPTNGYYGTLSSTSNVNGLNINYDPQLPSMYGTISECDFGEVYCDFNAPMFGTIARIEYAPTNIACFNIQTQEPFITSLDDYIPFVSPIFTPYFRIDLLRRIASNNSETKSSQIVKYYSSRTEECIGLVKTIAEERL